MQAIDLTEMLNEQIARDRKTNALPVDMQITRLKDHFDDFNQVYEFWPGRIVRTKPGIGPYMVLTHETPCIVLDVLKTPIEAGLACPAPEQGAKLGLRLGFLHENRFTFGLFEAAIFEPWIFEA